MDTVGQQQDVMRDATADFSLGQLTQRQLRRLRRAGGLAFAMGYGFAMATTTGAMWNPGQGKHVVLVQRFCRALCQAMGVQLMLHGPVPRQQALWVANHISWLDVAVIGARARVFFLAKAEIARWPVMGALARAGGTLFIQRGSGDAGSVAQQVADFLRQGMPVLFFPEATTTDGRTVRKVHGKLLAAALQTRTPIQPVVLCYVNQQGGLDLRVPFVDDITMAEHLSEMLVHDPVTAHVQALERIDPTGHDLESLRLLVQSRLQDGLQALHRRVLNPQALAELYGDREAAE